MNLFLRHARYNARKTLEILDEIGIEKYLTGNGLDVIEFYHMLAEAEDEELTNIPTRDFGEVARIWFTIVPIAWTMRFVGGLFNLIDRIKGH